ncbi:SDR family NAD(P)-dependent oxidoreductase [Micromonospora sp. NPDC000089]|uniref:type I polyketide synthase n=1 Tax=unclassified Micromonospora TaxID=2617518 RepID=UPI0036C54050
MSDVDDAVAVVGLACRFPGAADAGQFWRNLLAGVESVSLADRPAEEPADAGLVRAGGVLDDADLFDAGYFNVPPREADVMDPQHRIFLECAVTALEDAGYPARGGGAVGVYASCGFNSYLTHRLLPMADQLGDLSGVQWLANSEKDYLATRVSYKLGFTGPSMNVQSACSSALVAAHLASEALLAGECDAALVGAVSVGLDVARGYRYTEGGILSPDGRCRPFDVDAAGTVFGSGVGVVVLKRLADAIEAGDHVRAVILGTAVNNDGSRKVGFTAPSGEGQARVVAAAQAVAGVDPNEVSYVEAHGTGTTLGDQIEVAALRRVFGDSSGCALGSVKSNVGHLDTCAGMAGLIKTVLCVQHGTLVPTVNVRRPRADLGPFEVVTEVRPWPGPRVAGVSSFGIGGTNAHLVLRQAPPVVTAPSTGWHLLPVSARTETGLRDMCGDLAEALPGQASLADAAYTLQVGREPGECRRAVVAGSTGQAADLLRAAAQPVPTTGGGIIFCFPGQGSGHPGMAASAYRSEPVFQAELDAALEWTRPWTDPTPLRTVLLDPAADPALLARTDLAQPALFALEYALARWWMATGVTPAGLVGHSVGEYVAAALAGALAPADAARLVVRRGQLMAQLPPGGMLAVPLPEEELRPLLAPSVAVAAVNAPDRCVVGGPTQALAELRDLLAARGVAARPLDTRHAFHTRDTEPVLAAFRAEAERVPTAAPTITVVSTVTGESLTDAGPEHWVRGIREPVRFADAAALALRRWTGPVLEIGAGRALTGFVRRLPESSGRLLVSGLTGPGDGEAEPPSWLTGLADLWAGGLTVRWAAVGRRAGRRRVPLPTYRFARERHWLTPAGGRPPAPGGRPAPGADLLAPTWWRSPAAERPAVAPAGPVLVVADHGGLAVAFADRLRAAGATVYPVAPGESYPQALDGLERPALVLHARAVDGGTHEAVADPVDLVRALVDRWPDAPLRLIFVTACAQPVGAERPRHPVGAAVLGPVRVAPLEYPHLTARCVDVDPADPAVADGLLAEALADADEPLVVLRAGARWLPGHEPARLPATDGGLRPGGTYLVTGGLGGLGRAVAESFAARGAGTLVLLTRNAGPHRDTAWTRTLPATVDVVQVDVADPDALAEALDGVRRRHGDVHGVVHAAGVPGGGVLALRRPDEIATVLAPKVDGTVHLHRLVAPMRPDFFVLFSSVLALVGAPGQVDYVAANAFLDAFAHAHPGVTSIGWDRWSQVGMAVGAPLAHPLLSTRRDDGAARLLGVRRDGAMAWLADEHRVAGAPVLPAVALLELAAEAYRLDSGPGPVELRDAAFLSPAVGPVSVRRAGDGWQIVTPDGRVRAAGTVSAAIDGPGPALDLDAVAARCAAVDVPHAPSGTVTWGPRWDCVQAAWRGADEGLVQLRLADRYRADLDAHPLHPALLDVALGAAAVHAGGDRVPVACRRLVQYADLPGELFAHFTRVAPDVFDVVVADPTGAPVVVATGFAVRPMVAGGTPEEPPVAEEGIDTEAGLAVLHRVLAHPYLPHVVCSPRATPPSVRRQRPAATHERPELERPYTAPRDDLERQLAQLWADLLGVRRVGVHDSIYELGGDSLLIVQLAAEARKAGLELAPSDVFAGPTVAELAQRLRQTGGATPVGDAAGQATAPDEVPGADEAIVAAPFSAAELDDAQLAYLTTMFATGEESQR